jgi:hypothetical protein
MLAHRIATMSDEAFGWYLTGLSDGEACFHFREVKRPDRRPWFQGLFTISMRDDEGAGLAAIRDRMNCGALRPDHSPSRLGKGNPLLRWEVNRIADLATVVVPHFDRFPLQLKKRRDFVVWRRCIVLLHESTLRTRVGKTPTETKLGERGSRLPDRQVELLLSLIEELKAGRKYTPPTPVC